MESVTAFYGKQYNNIFLTNFSLYNSLSLNILDPISPISLQTFSFSNLLQSVLHSISRNTHISVALDLNLLFFNLFSTSFFCSSFQISLIFLDLLSLPISYDEGEASNGGEVSPDSNRQQKRSVGQIRVFPLTDQALQWNHHRIRITLTRTTAAARSLAPFPGVGRRRLRSERQLLVFSVDNRAPKKARNRRRAMVSLTVFDYPGGNGSFEEEGFAWLRFWWSFGHFGRIFEGDRRCVEANGRRFSERRRIGNEEEARLSNDLIWGFSAIWGFTLELVCQRRAKQPRDFKNQLENLGI